ncbi:MAG: SDR family oxidoreductase [Deltaproteobacteria bacterium]|jgi:2-deoxy-D-gluconate 3-dehydrogenase|nr:SDR family oxidoreductase [Deltaproteobacteria bacterium]
MPNVPSMLDLKGKRALITGAASGIGRAAAEALAGQGADVVLCDLKTENLPSICREISSKSAVKAAWREVDITKKARIDEMAESVLKEEGPVDILVNSAGVNVPQKAEDVTEEAWDLVHSVNLKGSFFCCQAVGRSMLERGYGKIINISSQAGSRGLLYRAAYCSSKGGLDQISRVLALEWSKRGVRVNSLAPTFLLTPLTEPMFKDPAFKDYVDSKLLIPRLAEISDLTGAIVFLASPASDMMTGTVLYVDGGWTAH